VRVGLDARLGLTGREVETYTHLIRVIDVTIAARQETRAEAVLTARPPKSAVSANGPELRVAGLGFVNGTAELTPSARTALVELADYLLRDSFGRSVRISGDGGESLAQSRALSIKQALIDAGVPDGRLDVATAASPKPSIVMLP
jgi:outer membrane protein OmpA-like peptidoglycan-associated protein